MDQIKIQLKQYENISFMEKFTQDQILWKPMTCIMIYQKEN